MPNSDGIGEHDLHTSNHLSEQLSKTYRLSSQCLALCWSVDIVMICGNLGCRLHICRMSCTAHRMPHCVCRTSFEDKTGAKESQAISNLSLEIWVSVSKLRTDADASSAYRTAQHPTPSDSTPARHRMGCNHIHHGQDRYLATGT